METHDQLTGTIVKLRNDLKSFKVVTTETQKDMVKLRAQLVHCQVSATSACNKADRQIKFLCNRIDTVIGVGCDMLQSDKCKIDENDLEEMVTDLCNFNIPKIGKRREIPVD